ncbi:hypothetical protein, partial [Candidatus Thiosymbion oneisti]|uniref:hypothetical protein n=1 Tax=Candidatus Thiosymbion oneisti TaxID=589554 RepID=UPI001C405165
VRRQSGAAASNLSHGGYQRRWPGIRALRFHPRRGDGAFPWPQHLCRERIHRQIQSGGRLVPFGRSPAYA